MKDELKKKKKNKNKNIHNNYYRRIFIRRILLELNTIKKKKMVIF